MIAMRRKMLHRVNSLLLLLISMLGFITSCEDKTAENGIPHASFIVTGEIKSAETNQPIPDIIVEMRGTDGVFQKPANILATGFSRYQGNYTVDMTNFPGNYTLKLKFTDTDGALNGEYESLDTTVVFKDAEYVSGDGQWYWGYAEKKLNVQLKSSK